MKPIVLLLLGAAAACAAPIADPSEPPRLRGSEWSLSAMDGTPLPTDSSRPLRIAFGADGRMTGRFCNHFFGPWEVRNGRLVTGTIGATRMSCGERVDALERRFFEILRSGPALRLGDSGALLVGEGEPPELRLERL